MKKFRMPPGFRFSPSDTELLYYLKMKAKGMSFRPWNDVILEKNLYAENAAPWMLFNNDDPWQVTSKVDAAVGKIYEEKVLYVVTKLVKIGSNKTMRSVGPSTWDSATGKYKVWNSQGQVMGFKKILNLRRKGMEVMSNWMMHAYHISGVLLQEVKDNDYVICRIKWDYSRNIWVLIKKFKKVVD
ncbi:NAC domain-containing protein JA2L-like [Coffea arabica]|uniref:NAC domain-containing protein JA2L-like n=1 Tax=Coffea arabica TaxID=13443 RepID=A0A6P6X8I9_COFAR|nr:NAC domain-containing protein 30-like [Coffea arabica]